jgi:hypothetical protein
MSSEPRLIVTAASPGELGALVCWLGALEANWPCHPPVLVYSLGLAGRWARGLTAHAAVRTVPAFCPHWQRHGTWKLWCLRDAPGAEILWIDVGLLVLRPLDEVFDVLGRDRDHFLVAADEPLADGASRAACAGCGVPPDFPAGKPALSSAVLGLRKGGVIGDILEEALTVAMVEAHVAPTEATHRREQSLLSLLFHKHMPALTLAPGAPYLASLSPAEVPHQRCWLHRGALLPEDARQLAGRLSRDGDGGGGPHLPASPPRGRAQAMAALHAAYWSFGRRDLETASRHLIAVFASDPGLATEASLLAAAIREYDRQHREFVPERSVASSFILWVLATIERNLGPPVERAVRTALVLPSPVARSW